MGDVDADLAGRLDRVAGAAVYEPQLSVQPRQQLPEPVVPAATSPHRLHPATPELAALQVAGAADVTTAASPREVAGSAVQAEVMPLITDALVCLARAGAPVGGG